MSTAVARADIGLAWSIRASFLNYLRRLQDATVSLSGGAATTTAGQFYFRFRSVEGFGAAHPFGTIRFSGQLRIDAHFGALSLHIIDPFLRIAPEGASLHTAHGPAAGTSHIADVTMTEATRHDDVMMWDGLEATLAEDAVMLFGGAYPTGARLSPLTVRIPAG